MTFKGAFEAALDSDTENVSETALNYLKDNYYESDIELTTENFSSAKVSEDAPLDLSFLTPEQEVIARPFLEEVMAQEDLLGIDKMVWLFERQVSNSTLNEEQKYQLFSMSSLVKQGAQMIKDAQAGQLVSKVNKPIDVKAALRAGVLGLASGALTGAYIGATGGTVVVPIVGTVVGGVGCAVVLGASGFVSGVAMSIVGDLLWD